MAMTIEIKEASVADAPAILDIIQDAFRKYEHDLGMTGHVTALKETVEDIERDIREKTVEVGGRERVGHGFALFAKRFGERVDVGRGHAEPDAFRK